MLKNEIRQDLGFIVELQLYLSLKDAITLALERESWSNKIDSESGANIKIAFSNHEKKHEHQLCDQTMEEKNKELYQPKIFPPNAIFENLCINQ